MRDPKERLRDILDGIANIERYAARGRQAFESDELIQNWFVRHLQIIGEAARGLPQELRDREQTVPWSKNHGYAAYPGSRLLCRGHRYRVGGHRARPTGFEG